jgi:hypothetical protein
LSFDGQHQSDCDKAWLQEVKHNGSLYAHVFVARAGFSADPSDPEYDQTASFSRTHREFSYVVCITKGSVLVIIKVGLSSSPDRSFLCNGELNTALGIPFIVSCLPEYSHFPENCA